jgi:nucleoside transporter
MTTSDSPYDPPLDKSAAPVSDDPQSTSSGVQARLCLMMFLQYFVQGCYLPIVSVYVQDALGFNAFQIGAFGAALAVGPLAAPFVLGQVVDRYLPTERVLAVCHFAGGLVMLAIFFAPEYWPMLVSESVVPVFWPMVVLGTIYSVLYVPSMMLSNSLAFHHLKKGEREFPIIRLFGTIGFVLPAWLIEMWWLAGREGPDLNSARGIAFCFAGIAGIVMALYSISLPHTPPDQSKDRQFAPGAVINMLHLRHFAVLVLITFLISIAHKFYFVWNSPFLKDVLRSGGVLGAWEQRISSIGQISEVAVMALVGLAVAGLGFKRVMLIGLVAYGVRCVILAAAISVPGPFWLSMTLACLGQAMHGFCFGCFFAVAFIFVDKVAPRDIRGSMQNLFGTFVIGLGFLVGGFVAGWVGDKFTTPPNQPTLRQSIGIEDTAGIMPQRNDQQQITGLRDWPGIWLSCGLLALLCTAAFAVLFPRYAEREGPSAENAKEAAP